MTGPILLTLDLGTTNCKAVAFELDGRPIASDVVAYPTSNPRDGWYEQRPSDWRDAIAAATRRVAATLGRRVDDVHGLAVSAWGPGLVLLDDAGSPMNESSPTWQDTRSLRHGEQLAEQAGLGWIGGGMPLTGFPAKLAWAIEAWPDLARSAAYAVGVKDYLLAWLTGVVATEPSSGPCASRWFSPAFATLRWDVARLPPVVESSAILGTLRADQAHELGLRAGVPVVAGLNDGAAATLGVGAHREGDVVVSLGTNGVLRIVTTTPPSPEICLSRSFFRYPLVDGAWACGGFVLSGGSALAWLAQAVGANDPAAPDIPRLLAEAERVTAGSDGVLFLPYLVGRGSPRPDADASGAFLGLRARHGRAHLTRAVIEGVAFGLREIAEEAVAQGITVRRLFVTGGGAASPLWRSVVAEVLGMPAQFTTGDSNLGSAIVLALGLGLLPDWESAIAQLVPASPTNGLLPAARIAYDDAYGFYLEAVARQAGAP